MTQLSVEQQQDLATLAYELGHNPQTRSGLAHLVHKINPQRAKASFPDVVQQEQFASLKREIREELDLNGARAAKARLEEQKVKLKERYSDEEITKIEQVADRYNMSDYDAAAVLYAHENGPADMRDMPPSPSERPGARWEFPTVTGRDGKPVEFKKFLADPSKHAVDAAYNIIHEFKNKSLSPGFRR